MSHQSVDQLQKVLTKKVFHYAKDSKKAAGRALGTLVEIITFYALKSWGFERHVAIERKLPEFANDDITHNVEYSLHPATPLAQIKFSRDELPLTTAKIGKQEKLAAFGITEESLRKSTLLSNDLILRNSCTVSEFDDYFLNAYLDVLGKGTGTYSVVSLHHRPFAMFECKRVGVEEGMKNTVIPQEIEKSVGLIV